MGQAKKRGTLEQRRQGAIELRVGLRRSQEAEQDRLDDLAYAERLKANPPQSTPRRPRVAVVGHRPNLMMSLAMVAAVGMASMPVRARELK